MSLINTYLKKAGRKQERKKRQPTEVPPFLLQVETEASGEEERGPTLMITLLFILFILLTGLGTMWFLREVRQSTPSTTISPPVVPVLPEHSQTAPPPPQPVPGAGQTATPARPGPGTDTGELPSAGPQATRPGKTAGPKPVAKGAEGAAPAPATPSTTGATTAPAAAPSPRVARSADIGHTGQQGGKKPAGPARETGEQPGHATAGNKAWPLPLEPGPGGKGVGEQPAREVGYRSNYLYQIGLQAQKNGDLGRAERYYRQALQQDREHLESLINLSALYIREERYGDALPLLDRIEQIDPGNAKALVNRGLIAMYRGKKEQAEAFFKKALHNSPTEETALVNLAYIAQQNGQVAQAEHYYQRLLRIAPDNREVLLAYANLEENRGQYDKAIALYRRGLDQLSMQNDKELYSRIRNRINLLRQYLVQQSYRKLYSPKEQAD